MPQPGNSLESSEPRHAGKVIWFQATKGFGFIRPNDSSVADGKELFVHFHYLIMRDFKTLDAGDEVEFSVGKNHEGLCAKDVKILRRSSQGEYA